MQSPMQSTQCDVSPVSISNGNHGFVLHNKESMSSQQHASTLPTNCDFNMKNNNKSNGTVNVNHSPSANMKTTTNEPCASQIQGQISQISPISMNNVPPNHLIVPPSYTLSTIINHQHSHSNINHQTSTSKNHGPKNDLINGRKSMITSTSPKKSSSAQLRGAEKIGFAVNHSLIVQKGNPIHHSLTAKKKEIWNR